VADAVQWTVTEFWRELQAVENQIHAVDAALQADKATLTQLYSLAKREYDPAGAHDRAYLEPLIHHNSVLRLSYLAPVKSKFNSAVASASAALKSAGYATPNLSGLGVVPAVIIVPAIAVAALGLAAAAVMIVNRLTESQVNRTATARAIFSDPNTTPEQKLQLAGAFQQEMEKDKQTAPPPLGFDTSWILPTAAVIALIVLGPQLLRAFGPKRAEA
jgi:hypothetical protein